MKINFNFQQYDTVFDCILSAEEFASALKEQTGSSSVRFSPVLEGKEGGKFIILTLDSGQSATMPASKKAVAGEAVTAYSFNHVPAEKSENGQDVWILCTSLSKGECVEF